MKRRQDPNAEMLARLAENIEKLLAAAERLAGAAEHGRKQLDRLDHLVAQAEDILQRGFRNGLSVEGDDACSKGRPVNIDPDPEAAQPQDDLPTNFGFGHFVEFSSFQELQKFQKFPPISGDDIAFCDFDEMIRQFLSDDAEC